MPRFWDWLRNRAPKKEKKKKRKKRRKDTPKDDIHGLHTQLETLRKRKEHLMNRMEEQDAIARRNVKTNKDAAKAALRRKKAHEHSIDQTIAQIRALELFASPEHPAIETAKQGRAFRAQKEASVI